jgi:hypothetical protein
MLPSRFRWISFGLAAFFLLAPRSRAGGVRIVEPTGTQNFATIQAAVDAAPEGSVLLVGEGYYPGFQVNGKSLAILAVPGADVTVGNWLSVSAIQAGQAVVLGGLHVTAQPTSNALTVSNSSGLVRFQDCQFRAFDWGFDFCPASAFPGAAGAIVTNCDRVLFSACTFQGGKAEDLDDDIAACTQPGPPGGAGLVATGSAGQSVVLYDCSLLGGAGGGVKALPGEGGPGASLSTVQVLASGTTFTGGPGGDNYLDIPGECDADGGPGCVLNGASLNEIGCTFQGGFGGFGLGCTWGNAPGVAGGSANSMIGPARRATILATVQSDASSWSVDYHGAAGDRPLLFTASSPQVSISLAFHGAWALRRNTLLSTKNLGLVHPDGTIAGTAPASDLPAGSLYQLRAAQIAVRATNGVYLGSPKDLLLLDRDSGPDCNGNGVSDFLDVIEGTSADANHNLIPDSCPGG